MCPQWTQRSISLFRRSRCGLASLLGSGVRSIPNKYQDKTRNAHRANNNTNTKHKTLNNFHKLTNLTHGHSQSSKKNSLKEKCSKSQNKSGVIASSSLNEFKTIISEELISHEKNKVKDSNDPFFD